MPRIGLALATVLVAALVAPVTAAATFPGANDRILFQRGFPGDLYSIAPEGGAVAPLVRGALTDATYSPDGTRIAFSRARTERSPVEIAVANADGSGVRAVTRQRGFAVGAAWSPDGSALIYAGDEGAPPPAGPDELPAPLRIRVVDVDGSNDRRLLAPRRDGVDPVYSPDGTSIAYQVTRFRRRVARNRIWVANADGTRARPVTAAGGRNEQNPSWSPDGTQLAIEVAPVGDDDRPRSDIAVMNADGGGLRRVASTRWWETNPIWSPDGTRIAFTSDRDTRPRRSERLGTGFELYTAAADGGDVRRLTANRRPALFPDWQTLPG